MDFDFIDELPTVFNILMFNPGAVVDDTAIERLLNWLEEICNEKKHKLVVKSLEFLKSEEIWKHSLTLSFALRYAGFLGYYYSPSTNELDDVIKDVLLKIRDHKQFTEATVQFGFYKCLSSLSKEKYWCKFIENFMITTFETFKNSYLYVKKAAVGFFASFLHTLVLHESPLLADIHKTIESISNPEQLHQVVESILLVSKQSNDFFLKFLYIDKLIDVLMTCIRSSQDTTASCLLLKSLESVFSVLTKSELIVDWCVLLSDENPEEGLIDLLKFVKGKNEFRMLVPSLCKSLMLCANRSCFSPEWNYKLLQYALSDVSYHISLRKEFEDDFLLNHGCTLTTKSWKKQLIATMGEMVMMEKKISNDLSCQKLLKSWRICCLKILTVSLLSNDSERHTIDENLITVMYDKKVPRVCFQYLKEMNFKEFDEELNGEFMNALWNCLFCHTDCPQVVCASLDLLSRYISQDERNLANLIDYGCLESNQSVDNRNYSLADILNKLLWDTNWEVQDSLIDVLLKIIQQAKSGSQVCKQFLEEYTFWVKVKDLINNQESYIRSKTVSFLGTVSLYKPTWEIFCSKYNFEILDLCKLLQNVFICEERQDDMFTRRSILQVFQSWALSKIEHISLFTTHTNVDNVLTSDDDIMAYLFKIMENGNKDFDWEVRKLVFSLCTDMATVASESIPWKKLFIHHLFDNDFSLALCSGVCDCEYLVKMESFKCLSFMKEHFLNILKGMPSISNGDNTNDIKMMHTITEYENNLKTYKSMDKKNFFQFIEQVDLEQIGEQLDILDVKVNTDPVSFIQDVIASAKQSEANLLDCY